MQGLADQPRDEQLLTGERTSTADLPARRGVPVVDPTPATLKLYAGDWAHFATWCRQHGAVALPASGETLGRYLLALAPTLSRGALGRRRAAVNAMHRQTHLALPSLDAAQRKAVRDVIKPRAAGPVTSPTPAQLVRIANRCPRDLPGLRDRALLLLAAATAKPVRHSRPSSPPAAAATDDRPVADAGFVPRLFLLVLDAEHVRFTAGGVLLQVKARFDEANPSRTVALTRSPAAQTCPVRTLEEWLRVSDTTYGPVFRKVDRWGNVEHGRLGPDAWHRILARRTGRSPRSKLA